MRAKSWATLGLTALVLVMVAGACAGAAPTPAATAVVAKPAPPPGAPAAPGAAATSPTSPGATVASPTAATARRPTGEITIAVADVGSQRMIPWFGGVGPLKQYFILVFDSLVGADIDGKLSTDTGIAYKWEQAPDKKSWTFFLRKGVKFHNGDEVTAGDVKFSLEGDMNPKALGIASGYLRKAIARIEVPDPYTVVVHLNQPSIFLPWYLSAATAMDGTVVPQKYFQQVGENAFGAQPAGSGPYKVVKNVEGAYVEFEAVEGHWRYGTPRYKKVVVRKVPEQGTRVAMLKTGEADVIAVSRDRVREVKAAGFNVFTKKKEWLVYFYFLDQHKPVVVADKAVRQAVNLSINRKELMDFVFAGMGDLEGPDVPFGSLALGMGGDPSITPPPYDPEKAKQVLADAGHKPGLEVSLYSYVHAAVPEMPLLTQAVAGYLEKAGMKPKIVTSEYAAIIAKRGAFQTAGEITPWATPQRRTLPDLLSIAQTLHHSESSLTDRKDPAFDRLVERATSATDEGEVTRLIGEMERSLRQGWASVPIAEIDEPYATGQKVQDWNLGRSSYDPNFLDFLTR